MKEKTRQLLDTARTRRLALDSLMMTKEGKRLQRQLTKARKAIAERLREIRREDGHHLARVWARAAG